MRLDRRAVVAVGLLAGLGAAIAAMPVWIHGAAIDQLGAGRPASVTGAAAATVSLPAALSVAAAILAGVLARGLVRRLCGVLAAGCGALVVVASLGAIVDPSGALSGSLVSPQIVEQARVTAWPWVAALLSVIAVFAGLAMATASWQEAPGRYERNSQGQDQRASEWDQLSAGQDPTA